MSRFRLSFALVVVVAVAVGATLAAADTGNGVVRVPKGEPVQIAVVLPQTGGAAFITPPIKQAIELAVGGRTIRGFPIKLNYYDGPCDDNVVANAATATTVVGNKKNVAVIGHVCSTAFAGLSPPPNADATALSIYENSGIVTINGSTTGEWLPGVGPNVFNGVAVPNPEGSAWYANVQALKSDKDWYAANFGANVPLFADLYYDATNLLLKRLAQESEVKDGTLVIDRAELAEAVRDTKGFCGVTGKVSLDNGGYRVNAITPCP